MKYNLFLSYSRKDEATVRTFSRAFDEAGLSYWIDKSLGFSGDDFVETIIRGIDDSDIFVVFLSESYNNNQWTTRELHYAKNIGKEIIVIWLDDTPPSGRLTFMLGHYDWLRFTGSNVGQIVQRVQNVLEYTLQSSPTDNENDQEEQLISQQERENSTSITEEQAKYNSESNSSSTSSPQSETQTSNVESAKCCKVKIVAYSICKMSIDGDDNNIVYLKENKVLIKELEIGEYILSFENMTTSTVYNKVLIIGENDSSKAISICFADIEKSQKSTMIKCFMAGSTQLETERNAFRAIVSEVDNKWNKYSVKSYTYEDFSRAYREGGNQEEYNYFIATQIDFMIFVLNGQIGDKTREELEAAKSSYHLYKRPTILIYVQDDAFHNGVWDEGVEDWIHEEKLYVITYRDIRDLKLAINKDLNEFLLNA